MKVNMKTKEKLIELIQYINVVIQDESNDYTEQEKIDLIKEYLRDNPETNIGISNNEFSSNISLLSANDNLNYPLIVALNTGQLEIANYLLDLKNVISDDMINQMKNVKDINPLYHLLNGDFELNKVKKIFDKILNLYKAHPNYYENDNNLKSSISNSFDRQISKACTEEDIAKIAELIKVLLYDHKDILKEQFLHAGESANYQKAKILLKIDSTVINAKNQDNQNALDLYIKSSDYILDRASKNNFALYFLLHGKGLDHGEGSVSFTEKFYNHISFDFDKNPLEIIKTIIKLQSLYQDSFKPYDATNANDVLYRDLSPGNEKKTIPIDLAEKIFGSNGDVKKVILTAEEEHDLWMVLKENQPSTYNIHKPGVLIVGGLNKLLPTKLAKEQFDQYGSLKNLALLKMFTDGLPSKKSYVDVKNGLINQDLFNDLMNFLINHTLGVNELGYQLAQKSEALNMCKEDIDTSAAGEQAPTESVD